LWSIADLLRGDFKQSQYGRIILPFTLLRRMECVLAPTKDQVVQAMAVHQNKPDAVREMLLLRAAGQQFFNASQLTLATLSDQQTASDLMSYVQSFSQDARDIFEHFEFENFVQQLDAADLLYQVVQRFAATDLSPGAISNHGMGAIFEELIRKFAESSNDTAGEHFTPRDIVQLTTSLVMTGQDQKLAPNSIVTIYDPTAGTGGLPTDMFYNTGIATYVWVLGNNKPAAREGKVQLIDGSAHFAKMRKSLGSKRQYITDAQIGELVRLYGDFESTPHSKIFHTRAFGYRRITVERPLRLNFQTSSERMAKLADEKALQKMGSQAHEALVHFLTGIAQRISRQEDVMAQVSSHSEEQVMHGLLPRRVIDIVLDAMTDHEKLSLAVLDNEDKSQAFVRVLWKMLKSVDRDARAAGAA
jgi:type I restriction-modification system DNA methylase subunit